MEISIRGTYVGVSRRQRDDKVYADVMFTVARRQTADQLGDDVATFRMDPVLFGTCSKLPKFSPVVVICDEEVYPRKDGEPSVVKRVIGIEPEAPRK